MMALFLPRLAAKRLNNRRPPGILVATTALASKDLPRRPRIEVFRFRLRSRKHYGLAVWPVRLIPCLQSFASGMNRAVGEVVPRRGRESLIGGEEMIWMID
jgi:hypothetical protein